MAARLTRVQCAVCSVQCRCAVGFHVVVTVCETLASFLINQTFVHRAPCTAHRAPCTVHRAPRASGTKNPEAMVEYIRKVTSDKETEAKINNERIENMKRLFRTPADDDDDDDDDDDGDGAMLSGGKGTEKDEL